MRLTFCSRVKSRDSVVMGQRGSRYKITGHISNHEPPSAVVKATLQLDGKPNPILVERCLERPDILICPDDAQQAVAEFGDVVRRGGVVLTRREILQYVTSKASDRGSQIQEILNLEILEDVRSSLYRARTELRRDKNNSGNCGQHRHG